jgi:tetratricopeptide (TPR) repeat protein
MPLAKLKSIAWLIICLFLILSCSNNPTEESIATRTEEYRQRASQYYNAGSYAQAFQQARLGLELDEEDGGLNLLAGRALMMQRDLQQVAIARYYLERAETLLDSYKAQFSLGEFHYRYGSMLNAAAIKQRQSIAEFPSNDEEIRLAETIKNEERFKKAKEHFADATKLLQKVLQKVPNDLNSLQLAGQCYSLLEQYSDAKSHLKQAIKILEESRQYKNRIIANDTSMSIEQEKETRRKLQQDIQNEVAIRLLLASINKKEKQFGLEILEYDIILSLDPKNLEAIYARGICHYQLGSFTECISDLEDFVSSTTLAFESPPVQRALSIITELKQ